MADTGFDCYQYKDYKSLLKARLSFLRKSNPSLSWRQLAQKVPVQATYLSKVLNQDHVHLSEEHLFCLGQWLDFRMDEIDFMFMLRSLSTATQAARRDYLTKKIEDIRKKRTVSADYVEEQTKLISDRVDYLLDPLSVIIHVSLFIKKYQKDPRLLCPLLGIGTDRLKQVLTTLAKNKYILLGDGAFDVTKVNDVKPHFGREHPLMRIHQSALKSNLLSRLSQTAETDKESFVVTFTMDATGFEKSKQAFSQFLKELQGISFTRRSEKLYQLSFDLVQWY